MSLLFLLGLVASSPTADLERPDVVGHSIDQFVNVCVRGEGKFAPSELNEITFGELPASFQRNFQEGGYGVYFRYSDAPNRYLVSYKTGAEKPDTISEVCAVAIEGITLKEGRAEVRKRLRYGGSETFSSKVKHIVDSGPSGAFEVHYYYLQNEDFLYNRKIGPRFLVLQVSLINRQ